MYGFTYRGMHCSELGISLLSYTVQSPTVREYEDEAAGRPGSIDYGSEWGQRQIDVKIDIKPNNVLFKKRQSQILNWLKPTLSVGILAFDDVPDRFYFAKFTGNLGIQQFNTYGQFEFSFKCSDPFAYGSEMIIETTITTSPSNITIKTEGTEPTELVMEMQNAGTQTINRFTITNEYPLEE